MQTDKPKDQKPEPQTHDPDTCPNCGTKNPIKGTFRTGSVGHPPTPSSACPKCGTRT